MKLSEFLDRMHPNDRIVLTFTAGCVVVIMAVVTWIVGLVVFYANMVPK